MRHMIVLALVATFLVGCSGTTHLGTVGDLDFYSVHAEHFTGPNFTSLVTERGAEEVEGEDGEIVHKAGKVRIEKTAFGPGIGPALVHGVSKLAADVGAATMYGHSLDFPDYEGDDIHVEGGDAEGGAGGSAKSKSKSKSKGGSATSTSSSSSKSKSTATQSQQQGQFQIQAQGQKQKQHKPKPKKKPKKPKKPKKCKPKKGGDDD